MKNSILIFVVLSTVLAACGGQSDKERELELREKEIKLKEQELGISSQQSTPVTKEPTEAELKQELFKRECSRATDLLSASSNASPKYKNLLSMKVEGLELSGTIRNSATIATFKNMKVKAIFKSKTGATIFTKIIDIYEFVGPNSSVKYKTEFDMTNQQYIDFDSFTFNILSAECH